jgi:ferrochelatase
MSKEKETIGILLLNLGGPDSIQAVRPFLYNLFSDRDIIKLGPSYLQKPIAWLISRFRSKKTEKMYRHIGGKSPILEITTAQAKALEEALNSSQFTVHSSQLFKVYIGMRYWYPSIKDTLVKIIRDGIKKLIVLSLYPHYSKATTGSAFTEFRRVIAEAHTIAYPSVLTEGFDSYHGKHKRGEIVDIQYIEHWYDFPPYIDALTDLISKEIIKLKGEQFELLYSAHSLPQSFIDEGDPYLDHIKATIEKVNKRLSEAPYNITDLKWHLSFQSKIGPVKWLKPTTEEIITHIAKHGCKNLLVVPVSFVSDHIETLYEIDILYKEIAKNHGINLKRCEALNMSDKFINALRELTISKLSIR